jgi:hypothetical protein
MATEMIYENDRSLKPIHRLLDEASQGLEDENRTIPDSSMPSVLGAAIGGGMGAVGSYAALYFLGTTGLSAAGITSALAAAGGLLGGGMVAGIGVLAAPVAVFAVVGYGISERNRRWRLKQEKERLLQQLIKKHDAVLKALKKKADINEERVKYLESLVILLKKAIQDLNHDLKKE